MDWILVIQSYICAALVVAGQSFWKIGLRDSAVGTLDNIKSWTHLISSKWMILGTILYLVATILWILLLKKYPLGVAYSLIIGFALFNSVFVSLVFLKESITGYQLAGLALLMISIFMIAGNK